VAKRRTGMSRMEVDSAALCYPPVLHIFGRAAGRENTDICGEYLHRGQVHGRPVYRQQGSATAIRYWPSLRRWVIDREGVRDSNVCVAFATDSADAAHPAYPELIWHVWESSSQAHVADSEVISVAAPRTVTLVGRALGRDADFVNGPYELARVAHGRPVYVHSKGELGIRYFHEEKRWAIVWLAQDNGTCLAYSEASTLEHPGHIDLEWMFWETQLQSFCADPATRTLVAPSVVRILGRRQEAENARINGSYVLAGVIEGRPAYVQPGTRHLIRYSSRSDRWLVETDGLVEPSLATRLYHWVFGGDLNGGDRCAAYANASASEQPGTTHLEWSVWESKRGCFIADPEVRCTTAPLALQVCGRARRENEFINGDYQLAGIHLGRVFYHKPGSQTVIRFWPPRNRWLIDGNGLQPSDACSAFADCTTDGEYPGDLSSPWSVYETARGSHLPDLQVTVIPLGSGEEQHGLPNESVLSSTMGPQGTPWHPAHRDAVMKDVSGTRSQSIGNRQGLYGA